MPDANAWGDPVDESAESFAIRRPKSDSELDMTPMIDCVFLLLIYFLVATNRDPQTQVELPAAFFGTTVSAQLATILTLADAGPDLPAVVHLGDGKNNEPVTGNDEEQTERIKQYIAEGLAAAHTDVLIKGDKTVKARDITRVSQAIAAAVSESGRELLAEGRDSEAESDSAGPGAVHLFLAVADPQD
jgi:biopolymer transport protein ExbD